MIAGPWRYDLYGQYYYTSFTQGNFQYLSLSRMQNALQVRSSPGGPVCISGGTCVPLNIFAGHDRQEPFADAEMNQHLVDDFARPAGSDSQGRG